MADQIDDLLTQRDAEYGPAWLKTADAMHAIGFASSALASSPHAFNWVIILNKLVRALRSPNNPDHWRDIAGYAILSADFIRGEES